ncbi:MAG TPA: MFS transporter, partial [Xanthomonadales bacterium]|nr:MFS transporter [Xanthomonadales bacterium]
MSDNEPAATSGQSYSPSYRLYVLGMLTLVYVFNFLDRQLLVILQEPIKAELGLSDTQLGLLSGLAFAAVYVTAALPLAQLAERWSRRSMVAVSLATWSGMTAITGFVTSFYQLLIARAAVGIGEAGASPASHSIISDIFPLNRRATALAFYSIGINLGVLLGFLLGGWINEFFGWRMAFIIVGLPGILLALAVRFSIREPAKGLSMGIKTDARPPAFFKTAVELWRKPSFRNLALGTALQSMVGYAIVNWLPSYMIRMHGMGTGEVGTWLALSAGAAGALGTFGGGWLADRLAVRDARWYQWVSAGSAMLVLPMMCLVLLAGNPTIAMLLFIIPACVQTACIGPSLAATHALVDIRSKSVGSAILFFVVNLIGLGLGPLSVGIVSDYLEPTYGNASLRWALLSVVILIGSLSITHFMLAARTFRQDSAAMAAPTS